jgi:hypothetical protein
VDGLFATLAIYRLAFSKGARLALRNWPVLASVFVYAFIFSVTAPFAALLGILGGFAMALVFAACVGSFLYLVEMMVRTSRVTLADFKHSFTVYLWDIVAVNFVLWIGGQLVDLGLAGLPQAGLIRACVSLLVVVFFNAVPELIYFGHHTAVALLAESYRFIAENWIEWFPPNLLMLAILYGISQLPGSGLVFDIGRVAITALFVYFAMVVRGFLFAELSATSRRGRIFRHRSGR